MDVMGNMYFTRCKWCMIRSKKLFVLLTNWGRIGESGKYQQTPFSSRDAVIKEFCKIFKSKSANMWSNRREFAKKPGKYVLVHTARTRIREPEKMLARVLETTATCTLDAPVAETLQGLLSWKALMAASRKWGLDQSQCPLANLSLDTLDKA